jgi:hypothetical protein
MDVREEKKPMATNESEMFFRYRKKKKVQNFSTETEQSVTALLRREQPLLSDKDK